MLDSRDLTGAISLRSGCYCSTNLGKGTSTEIDGIIILSFFLILSNSVYKHAHYICYSVLPICEKIVVKN